MKQPAGIASLWFEASCSSLEHHVWCCVEEDEIHAIEERFLPLLPWDRREYRLFGCLRWWYRCGLSNWRGVFQNYRRIEQTFRCNIRFFPLELEWKEPMTVFRWIKPDTSSSWRVVSECRKRSHPRFRWIASSKKDTNELLPINTQYGSLVDGLLYVSVNTRPDIAASVTILGRKMSCPSQADWEEAKRVLRYFKHTLDHELICNRIRWRELDRRCDG